MDRFLFGLLFLGLTGQGASAVSKVGCYAKKSSLGPKMSLLMAYRKDFSMHSNALQQLLCYCVLYAQAVGFTQIGITNFMECRSGPELNQTYILEGDPRSCIGIDRKQCSNDSTLCSGDTTSLFVYNISAVPPLLQEWSAWGRCYSDCFVGIQFRFRSQNPHVCTWMNFSFQLLDMQHCVNASCYDRLNSSSLPFIGCYLNNQTSSYQHLLTRPVAQNTQALLNEFMSDCVEEAQKFNCSHIGISDLRECKCYTPPPSPASPFASCFDGSGKSCSPKYQGCSGNFDSVFLYRLNGAWPSWSSWSPWGACHGSCGPGLTSRTRSCVSLLPIYKASMCKGDNKETKQCKLRPCPGQSASGGLILGMLRPYSWHWSTLSVCFTVSEYFTAPKMRVDMSVLSPTELSISWFAEQGWDYSDLSEKSFFLNVVDFDNQLVIFNQSININTNYSRTLPEPSISINSDSCLMTARVVEFAQTWPSVPSGPPRNLTLLTLNSSCLSAQWMYPSVDLQNSPMGSYSVRYSSSPGNQTIMLTTPTRTIVLCQLPSSVPILFSVAACYSGECGPTAEVTHTIYTDVPRQGPQGLVAMASSPLSLHLAWSDPVASVGDCPIIRYLISYSADNTDKQTILTYKNPFEVNDLLSYTVYSVNVSVCCVGRCSPPASVSNRTLPSAPTGPPQNVVLSVERSCLNLSWSAPSTNHQRGDVSSYIVGLFSESRILIPGTQVNNTRFNHCGIRPGHTYSTEVLACTLVGCGPSKFESVTIPEEAPSGPPLMFSVSALNSASIIVSWSPPEPDLQNGFILNYVLSYSVVGSGNVLNSSVPSAGTAQINNLFEYTQYLFQVSACTAVGCGIPATVMGRTRASSPATIQSGAKVTLVEKSASTITVSLPQFVDMKRPIKAWFVITDLVHSPFGFSNTMKAFTSEYEMEELPDKSMGFVDIAMNLSSWTEKVVVGDEKTVNGIYNRPLSSNTEYRLMVYACNSLSCGRASLMGTVTTSQNKSFPVPIVVGVIVGVLTLVGVAVIVRKMCIQNQGGSSVVPGSVRMTFLGK